MKKPLHIAVSPLSNAIYVGHIMKPGVWSDNKQDLTVEALVAVAEHTLSHKQHTGDDVVVSKADGTPEFKITVERL